MKVVGNENPGSIGVFTRLLNHSEICTDLPRLLGCPLDPLYFQS